MPVKVRCTGCQKVLNAPDAARGKAVKCPHCETRIRIPAGKSGGEAGAKVPAGAVKTGSRTAKRTAARKPDTEEIFARLDLKQVEDRRARVCPKCGTDLDEEDIECPACGVDPLTGRLTARQAKKRSMRGPDPGEFYGKAWTDSWQFLGGHMSLAWKTGLFWTIFMVCAAACEGMVYWCENTPPKVFWGVLATLCRLGVYGWYWYLAGLIITTTMQKKKLKKVEFDFTANVSLGIKALVWPVVLVLPFFWFPPAWFLPLLVFPLAMVHMTAPYTYKAWVPWDMTLVFFRNIGPALYWWVVALIVGVPMLALAGGILVGMFLLAGPVQMTEAGLHIGGVERLIEWALGLVGSSRSEPGIMGWGVVGLIWIVVYAVMFTPVAFLMAFPAVFLMRVNGLLGYYNHPRLDIVREQKPNVPAGFWPRYLAFMVDQLMLTVALGIIGGILVGMVLFLDKLMGGIGALVFTFVGIWYLATFLVPFLYYCKGESGPGQGTIGKRALGLIVTDMEGKPIRFGTAIGRYFGRIVSGMPLYLGFIMAGFTEKKQTLHDMMSKTQVVWRGDDEATTQ